MTITQISPHIHPMYRLQPAQLDLAEHVGKLLAWAQGDKLARAQRIYSNLTPEAKARADFARSWLVVEGGPTND